MSCQDCSGLEIQASSLRRRLDRAEQDIRELESERAGLVATVGRLREQLLSLAAQQHGGI
jgi:hypothetical protein